MRRKRGHVLPRASLPVIAAFSHAVRRFNCMIGDQCGIDYARMRKLPA
jgi:hypothetical protein